MRKDEIFLYFNTDTLFSLYSRSNNTCIRHSVVISVTYTFCTLSHNTYVYYVTHWRLSQLLSFCLLSYCNLYSDLSYIKFKTIEQYSDYSLPSNLLKISPYIFCIKRQQATFTEHSGYNMECYNSGTLFSPPFFAIRVHPDSG